MQTIGQKLKQARESKLLSLEKVFEATRIRVQYLKALEADDLSSMPSPVQARGYIRNYAEFLGLDFDQLLEAMRADKSDDELITPMDSVPGAILPSALSSRPEPTLPPSLEPAPAMKEDSQPRPIIEDAIQPQETKTDGAVSETLWPIWLNRLSSVIPVRVKRSEVSLPKSEESQTIELQEPEAIEPQDLQPSDEIFKEIGAELRKRREMLSLHISEVERNTRLKEHYIEALETGAMDKLPSTVQTRGMLSNYATFLDLDVDAILLRYADALQARHRERHLLKPLRELDQPILTNIPPLRSFIAGDLVFGIGFAVLLVGFLVWAVNRVADLQSQQEIQLTAPSISDILLSTSDPSLFTPTATLALIEESQPTVTIVIPTQNLNVNVQVNFVAVERTYMRVIVDATEVYNGRVEPGTSYPFEAEEQVEVLVGNGAAIRVVYNGRDLGLLGGFGQVVNNIYREAEIVTPTALPTQIPTRTFTPTATLRPTSTSVPTNTPRSP